MSDEFYSVGKSLPRLDAYEKATGKTKYIGDLKIAGMLWAKMLRSPHARARIASIDTRKAESYPGVKAVVTYKDVPVPLRFIGECSGKDHRIFEQTVAYVGDPVAGVAAVDERTAEEALDMINVEYEELPAVFSREEALREDAPIVPPVEIFEEDVQQINSIPFAPHLDKSEIAKPSNLCTQARRNIEFKRGSLEEGFKDADLTYEDRLVSNFVTHVPMENAGCLCYWEADRLVVVCPTQTAHRLRASLAHAFDLPHTRVKVISTPLGGSFGAKYEGVHIFISALLSKKTGRPVKMVLTRQEQFISKMRPAVEIIPKVGVKRDGTLTAIKVNLFGRMGARDYSIETEGSVPVGGLTRCPNVEYNAKSVYTNHPPTGEMRGVTNLQVTFGLAQILDQIAHDLGMDPVDFWLRNGIRKGDRNSDASAQMLGLDHRLSSCGLEECIKEGAKAIDWFRKRKERKKLEGTKRRGLGMSVATHHSGFPGSRQDCMMEMNLDGSIVVHMGASEHGQGITTTAAQVASEVLRVPLSRIGVITADTEAGGFDVATVGSVSAHVQLNAVKKSAEQIRDQLLAKASEILKASVSDLELGDNFVVFVKGSPQRRVNVGIPLPPPAPPHLPMVGRCSWGAPVYPEKARWFGANFAEVEVDLDTGYVTVLEYVSVNDVGKAINPLIVHVQSQGAAAMGMGMALMEELVFDESGRALNATLVDYRIPSAHCVPDVKSIIVETIDPLGPFGAKGFGEGPNIPVVATIANAIYDAIGVRIKELPVTPEKILKAIKEKKA